ncbi:hypothetical protein TeGR_g3091, partial [Tetraparma gracilis]
LTHWSQIKSLCTPTSFPELKSLILNENALPEITPVPASSGLFKSLRALQISNTAISAWTSLDSLMSFPALSSLRFANSPLTAPLGGSEARTVIIARVPGITFLNASTVSEKERSESEKMYLRRVTRQLQVGENEENEKQGGAGTGEKRKEILAAHPLFESLSTKHAASMMPAGDGSSASSLGSDTINVTIHSLSAASCTAEPMSKRLPASLQIGRLKQMCKRVFKLDIDLQ